ncbi:MAG: hypothetical protein QG602_4164 [Verrucomicrobiota bacterium]|nr:hypothetical protein [Verrucomicrobiota bacterium]
MRNTPFLLSLAALAVVTIQAMALATRYFQPWLDGDYLLAERFAADVLSGVYPLSGWTLSSSPYLFPDFALSIAWRALLGLGGAPLLPFYVVMSYTALALLAGWSLQRARGTDSYGWLLGALLVNAVLAWQGSADHDRWLWWLGVPNMHGGAVLLGLAQVALWLGPSAEAPSRIRWLAGTVLLFLGLASDTLLFTQFVAPLGAALFIGAPQPRWQSQRLHAFVKAVGIALLFFLLLRLGLHLLQWGNYPSVVRYAPTPSAIASTGARMFGDLTGPAFRSVPGLMALSLLSLVGALWLARRLKLNGTQRQAGWVAALCLLATFFLPVLAVYWRNPQHGRYLLPCLVIPLWWLLTLLPLARMRTPLAAGLVAVSLIGLAIWRVPQIDFSRWTWPYPERVADLDGFFPDEERAHGLAEYWTATSLNAVSQKVHLNQVRPDGRVQFWGNNAFHHFTTATSGDSAPLHPRRYSFIIANDLDPVALRAKFGEPGRIANLSGYEVWLYDSAGSRRISSLVDAEVRTFLGDRPGTKRVAKP